MEKSKESEEEMKKIMIKINNEIELNEKERKLYIVNTVNVVKDKEGNTVLMSQCITGSNLNIKELLENGADLSIQNNFGNTALMLASENGHKEIVEVLLEKIKHENLLLKNNKGETALMLASQKGHRKIVEVLLEKLDEELRIKYINIQNKNDNTVNDSILQRSYRNC